MITGFGSVQTAVEAMQMGAADYLMKPCNNTELIIKIQRALDARRKENELLELRKAIGTTFNYANIISRSERMKDIIRLIQQVADSDLTVLIQGESGTGKELVARALHHNSKRKQYPFIAVNCSALPENLLESELFGHEKGAFTGADRQKIGRFEEAHLGTLFLDEIGDLSPNVQVKLLRVLQEKAFERVGGNQTIRTDARIVVATNRDLETMMRQEDFREDLFYRLNVFPITLPSLRERLEDIPLLAEYFVHRHEGLGGGRVKFIAPSALNELMNHQWRGNIRELENLVKRAMVKASGDTIATFELPSVQGRDPALTADMRASLDPGTPFKEYLSAIIRHAEEGYIIRMLQQHKGNINLMAKMMDVDRKTIYRKLAEYSIDPALYRQ
jgi:DNA-binding NtrC family response regulator